VDTEFLVSYSCVTIKPDVRKVSGLYLFYYFKSNAFLTDMQRRVNVNTQGNVGVGDIRKLKIVLPTLPEQLKIIDYLNSALGELDAASDLAQATIALAKEKRFALISAAVTGKIDVRGWQPPASAPTPELAQEAV
jgi:type I restriction enzyme S subunit